MAYSRPDLLHHILKTTTEAVTQYLHAQIEAGVDTIMIFDSWGWCTLSSRLFRIFIALYESDFIQFENDEY
jgi:uroporphyrinogen-III decarboxylase